MHIYIRTPYNAWTRYVLASHQGICPLYTRLYRAAKMQIPQRPCISRDNWIGLLTLLFLLAKPDAYKNS